MSFLDYKVQTISLNDEVYQGIHLADENFAVYILNDEKSATLPGQTVMHPFSYDAFRHYEERFEKAKEAHWLFIGQQKDAHIFMMLSKDKNIRSHELLEYIISSFGLVKGNHIHAIGWIPAVVSNVQSSVNNYFDNESVLLEYQQLYLSKVLDYFKETKVIYAKEFAAQNPDYKQTYPLYQKKPLPWAYVETDRIAPEGCEIYLKTFENESGVSVKAGRDNIIMIGIKGEVYPIKREVFEKTYQPTEEELDIFENMMEYLPAAEIGTQKEYVGIDEYAKLCYPKNLSKVYVKKLDQRVKIFPIDEKADYFLGQIGDYLVVREDQETDVYIIREDILPATYALVSI